VSGVERELIRDYAIDPEEDHLQVAHDTLSAVLARARSGDLIGSWHQLNGALQRMKILLARRSMR